MTAGTPTSDPDRDPAAADDRAATADSFARLGPLAPTILPGWNAADLLDHLLTRERSGHLLLAGRLPGPFGSWARAALAEQRTASWQKKVAMLREGPSSLSPVGRMDAFTGQAELLIHHEDLRRAQAGWRARPLSPDEQRRAWRAVGLFARSVMRVPVPVTLVSPLGGLRVGTRHPGAGLRVHGDPLELLLWVSGRDEVAQVQVHGDEQSLRALEQGRRGV